MSKIDRIILKMKNQPNGISFDEANKVLQSFGYSLLRQRGSHCSYRNADGEMIIIVNEKPLKAVYVKNILKSIMYKEK